MILISIVFILMAIVLLVLFRKNIKKVLLIIFVIILILIIKDVASYEILKDRKKTIENEIRIGVSEADVYSYMEANKEKLKIREITKVSNFSLNNDPALIIYFDGPFSLIALNKEYENAWHIVVKVDKKTGLIEEVW